MLCSRLRSVTGSCRGVEARGSFLHVLLPLPAVITVEINADSDARIRDHVPYTITDTRSEIINHFLRNMCRIRGVGASKFSLQLRRVATYIKEQSNFPDRPRADVTDAVICRLFSVLNLLFHIKLPAFSGLHRPDFDPVAESQVHKPSLRSIFGSGRDRVPKLVDRPPPSPSVYRTLRSKATLRRPLAECSAIPAALQGHQ